ncbi:Permease [Bifidobacterium imperatoris]|uniref:Permease n=1 Tax=Bifidobacterium imperatoris TaxID=2020965 RepID=A0A2N5IRY4_9BIFI|nr:Permease [Bifidobacterium imperatoris]
MKTLIRRWMRGIVVSLASLAVYAIALGCFIALMLLVISMEEGGDNLTDSTIPLTKAIMLLSEGSGFETDSIKLTIIPLLLTVLLIWLIDTMAVRLKAVGIHEFAAGLIAWLIINEYCRRSLNGGLVDAQWVVLAKAALIFILGYALALLIHSEVILSLNQRLHSVLSVEAIRCIKLGIFLGLTILGLYLLAGLITVIVWIALNNAAVVSIFTMSGMETGSRILTSIAMIIWLPNVMIWAISWLVGAGFAIGDLANFTLWVGQSSSLPAVPAFGIFPEPVTNEIWRTVAMCTPFIIAFIAGLLMLFLPRGFRYRPMKVRDAQIRSSVILDLLYPAASFSISAVIISLGSSLCFVLSNGSLGSHRLANVGVNVMASTRAVGHPAALGLAAAWLIALIGTALVFSIFWIVGKAKSSNTTVQTARSTASKPHSDVSQSQKSKEEQG